MKYLLPAALAVLFLLSSCKGRTKENMEPTGDTVEVVIGEAGVAPAPEAATPADSATSLPE